MRNWLPATTINDGVLLLLQCNLSATIPVAVAADLCEILHRGNAPGAWKLPPLAWQK